LTLIELNIDVLYHTSPKQLTYYELITEHSIAFHVIALPGL